MSSSPSPTATRVVVVGGGQAGLAIAHFLTQQGRH
jgi:cation diffusion facilitator CzcD-associated flavoprotein CzcO